MIDYDAHTWRSHFFDIKGSMVREILGRVAACVGWSALVVFLDRHVIGLAVPSVVHSLVGTALGLLLVFRTNASYDRYWEGRKLWGGIINECRNLARMAQAYLKDDPALVDRIVRWTVAFPYACMSSLRGRPALGPAAALVDPDGARAVVASPHLPSAVAQKLTDAVADARDRGLIGEVAAMGLDANIVQLVDYIGACERIKRTPLPFAYVVHLRRALLLYCFTLPFALVHDYGWWTVLDTLLVAYVFFGIEEIGVEIEGPFGLDDNDLPLEDLCATVQRNLLPPRTEAVELALNRADAAD